MRGEVEAHERRAALRHGARLALAVAREPVLERVEPRVQRLRVVRGDELGDGDVAAREDRAAGAGAGGDLDLERLVGQPARPQRREAADLARVVRPRLGLVSAAMTASADGISTGGYVCQTCSSGGADSGVSSPSLASRIRLPWS